MNKIKIYLQRPWKISDSPYYHYLLSNPPSNVEYINTQGKRQGVIENHKKFRLINNLKGYIKKAFRIFYKGFPNAHYTFSNEKYDLIHCAHCMSLNHSPWIMDIEFVNQFWASGNAYPNKKKTVLKILKNNNCKKILAWTEWTKQGILEILPEIKDKIEVVYPAIPSRNISKKENKDITLLFISRRFYFKGGLHALEVMDRLTKKYSNIKGIIVSDTPREVISHYSQNKNISFFEVMPQKELMKKVYPLADIFIYPSYTDTFGFGLTEALSFGLPVITVDGQARKEIIQEGKTGFVIPAPKNLDLYSLKNQEKTIQEIVSKASLLIENKTLRKTMSKNALNEIKTGRFSITERNKKLKLIFQEAIR
ncbi:MAG: glycosyltransferase family 4 protein [Nanoarchaeota archaeon]